MCLLLDNHDSLAAFIGYTILYLEFYCMRFVWFVSGITPKITNEVGLYVDTTLKTAGKTPQAAMLNSQGTRMHQRKSASCLERDKTFISFPNDRACSVRPSNRKEAYK